MPVGGPARCPGEHLRRQPLRRPVDPLHRLTRRHVLTRVFPAVVAVPAVSAGLGGCSLFGTSAAGAPDPLPGLADAARADAARAASLITADPGLPRRLEPLRAARATHA